MALQLAWPSQAMAWGANGHRIVARIAQRHLSEAAAAEVARLLQGGDLAEASNWPDDIRSDPRWDCSRTFHYVTVPAGRTYPHVDISSSGDAITAVLYYLEVLRDSQAGLEEKSRALRFLVHFVGDLSQPLHVGLGCDAGGNQIKVAWFGKDSNLHSVWDEGMIQSRELSFSEFVDLLDRPAAGAAEDPGRHLDPLRWIEEAQGHLPLAYQCYKADGCSCFCGECETGASSFGGCGTQSQCRLQVSGAVSLSWTYRSRNREALDSQLRAGGLRLAALLNWVFSGDAEEPEALSSLGHSLDQLGDWRKPFRTCTGAG